MKLEQIIKNLLQTKDHVVIVFDGMSASLKTTYSTYLQNKYQARVIHMDDFYLPLDKREKDWEEKMAGNIDFVRFQEEVVDHINEDINLRKYSCKNKSYSDIICLRKTRLTIIEGAYALHPIIPKYFDEGFIFLVDDETQKARIIKREGINNAQNFIDKWVSRENYYLSYFHLKRKYLNITINDDDLGEENE